MKKWIGRLAILLVLGVFVFSVVKLLQIRKGYRDSEAVYSEAVSEFTRPSEAAAADRGEPVTGSEAAGETEPDGPVCAPIVVDFEYLQEVNPDVIAWLYCPDSVINYPVVYGKDNHFYLERDYRRNFDPCGTIFSDAANVLGFDDSNIILYGHHMQNHTMFATLYYWLEQEYCDEHPVMWVLTPDQDYRLELFAGYETQATSETYTVFHQPGETFRDYLERARENSKIRTDVELDPEAHYMVLSTCSNTGELDRTVLHGKLVPIDSAGGKLLP